VVEQGKAERDESVRETTRAMAEGSERAFAAFHAQYFDRMFRMVLARCRGDEHLARELTQQVYLRLARHGREFEGEGKLWAWLRQAAQSCHVDYLRRHGRDVSVELAVFDAIPAEEVGEDLELHQALDAGLMELEPGERELVELSYFEALPHQAIAERLEITSKAVEGRLARTRTKLREYVMKALKTYALL